MPGQLAVLAEKADSQAELLTKQESKLGALVEQSGRLMVAEAQHGERLTELEGRQGSLEAAEQYLQDCTRQLTEKLAALEEGKVEDQGRHLASLASKVEELDIETRSRLGELEPYAQVRNKCSQ